MPDLRTMESGSRDPAVTGMGAGMNGQQSIRYLSDASVQPSGTERLFAVAVTPDHTVDFLFHAGRVVSRRGTGVPEALAVSVAMSCAPLLVGQNVLSIIFPLALIRSLIEAEQGIRVTGIDFASETRDDPFAFGLALAVLDLLKDADAHGCHIRYLVRALAGHIGYQYASIVCVGADRRSDNRRIALAKDLLARDLDGHPDIPAVARACQLSVGGFQKAFREATGLPPLRWLRSLRIERAKVLLAEGALSLADIAASCGFADQSHFTRAFSDVSGVAPGRWRRTHPSSGEVGRGSPTSLASAVDARFRQDGHPSIRYDRLELSRAASSFVETHQAPKRLAE